MWLDKATGKRYLLVVLYVLSLYGLCTLFGRAAVSMTAATILGVKAGGELIEMHSRRHL
jgi:hypothetical protein